MERRDSHDVQPHKFEPFQNAEIQCQNWQTCLFAQMFACGKYFAVDMAKAMIVLTILAQGYKQKHVRRCGQACG